MSSYGSMLFGATSFIWILYAFLWLFPVAYLILRWRAYREQTPPDPHLGIKAALYYFKTLAYHVVLVGTFCLIFGLINDQACYWAEASYTALTRSSSTSAPTRSSSPPWPGSTTASTC